MTQSRFQEVKQAAAAAMQELATYEKQQVNLEERRKHATSKAKKLKKSVQEVLTDPFLMSPQSDICFCYLRTKNPRMKRLGQSLPARKRWRKRGLSKRNTKRHSSVKKECSKASKRV